MLKSLVLGDPLKARELLSVAPPSLYIFCHSLDSLKQQYTKEKPDVIFIVLDHISTTIIEGFLKLKQEQPHLKLIFFGESVKVKSDSSLYLSQKNKKSWESRIRRFIFQNNLSKRQELRKKLSGGVKIQPSSLIQIERNFKYFGHFLDLSRLGAKILLENNCQIEIGQMVEIVFRTQEDGTQAAQANVHESIHVSIPATTHTTIHATIHATVKWKKMHLEKTEVGLFFLAVG